MTYTKSVFNYKSALVRNRLYSGMAYTILGVLSFIFPSVYVFNFIFLVFGGFYLVQVYRWKNFGYISISDICIKKNSWLPVKIDVKDITGIRYYIGEIRVLSDNKSMRIEKEYLNNQDLEILEEKLKHIIFREERSEQFKLQHMKTL